MDGDLRSEALVQIVTYLVQVGFRTGDKVERTAFLGQNLGDGTADPLAGARDDCGLAGQFQIHDFPLG